MDRVVIVTGMRHSIGHATVIRLVRDFGTLALMARTQDTLARPAHTVRTAGAEPFVGGIDALACITGTALRGHNGETKML